MITLMRARIAINRLRTYTEENQEAGYAIASLPVLQGIANIAEDVDVMLDWVRLWLHRAAALTERQAELALNFALEFTGTYSEFEDAFNDYMETIRGQ